MEILQNGNVLALIFAALMGFAILVYSVLDGYDLGIGILLPTASDQEKDRMIASIGPFWDANETWLVLGVGLLLVAFPSANGEILGQLYLPVLFMLIGLILRGVAFDFRTKAKDSHKKTWNLCFFAGSLLASFSQGYMLGSYILGFEKSTSAFLFSLMIGFCVVSAYCLIGACWLIIKTENILQKKAVQQAKLALIGTTIGIVLISVVTPLASERIFVKWFSIPEIFFLSPIPLVTGALLIFLEKTLHQIPRKNDKLNFVPFFVTIAIFVLCFCGLTYSFYPYIIPNKMLIVDAATSKEAMLVMLFGTVLVLPILIGYTCFSYYVFRGKAKDISYN